MENDEARREFFDHAVPFLPELFNMAYAICNNYETAEFVLEAALVEEMSDTRRSGTGLREDLRATLRRIALDEAAHSGHDAPEGLWNGLRLETEDPVMHRFGTAETDLRRLLTLRYGCGLAPKQIAGLTGQSASAVREKLTAFERELARRLPREENRRIEPRLWRGIGRAMSRTDPGMPSTGALYRSFCSAAAEVKQPRRLLSRVLSRVFLALLVLAAAFAFWLLAALIQPEPAGAEVPSAPAAGACVLHAREDAEGFS